MPDRGPFRLIVTGSARRDIAASVRWSFRKFGEAASLRYETLIYQALLDIQADPERMGTKARPEVMIDAARTYHISFSRSRTPPPQVKSPRHFLVYRAPASGLIEVSRVLYDSRDVKLHLPGSYRR